MAPAKRSTNTETTMVAIICQRACALVRCLRLMDRYSSCRGVGAGPLVMAFESQLSACSSSFFCNRKLPSLPLSSHSWLLRRRLVCCLTMSFSVLMALIRSDIPKSKSSVGVMGMYWKVSRLSGTPSQFAISTGMRRLFRLMAMSNSLRHSTDRTHSGLSRKIMLQALSMPWRISSRQTAPAFISVLSSHKVMPAFSKPLNISMVRSSLRCA
mmetsp:Transcript_1568/g.2373  ORF Transcript_1568/g.2373 Transcript_1568/m.2373 type:complete len:212 (+) Transcript_1568:967-1602(+)